MSSKLLMKVYRLLKTIYPVGIWKETNLYSLVDGTNFSRDLKALIARSGADLKRMHVDLYVKGQIAIEVHGEQHLMPIKFSNEIIDPEAELEKRRQYDEVKRRALLEAGIPFIAIWFHEVGDGFTMTLLRARIAVAQGLSNKIPRQRRVDVKTPKFRTRTESFEARKQRLEKARKARKEQYRKGKEARKGMLKGKIYKSIDSFCEAYGIDRDTMGAKQ